jgi:hypothetical protein
MHDGRNDFCFQIGSGSRANRRLSKALADSTESEEFPSHTTNWSIFGGAGNMDELARPTKEFFFGLTACLFDPLRPKQSLYWINSRTTVIDPPVVGRFVDGAGEVFCDDSPEGTPDLCRFIRSPLTSTSAHREQALPTDGGQRWESNWMSDLTRTEPRPA